MDDLQDLITKAQWSPRAAFPPSSPLDRGVFSCGGGIYLMTNDSFGEGDPVRAVGWAESDYWARRCWASPPFPGDLNPPPAQWGAPPSLAFLGRPARLSFGEVREYELAQPGGTSPTLVTARYRVMTDGKFLSVKIRGAGGVSYFYPSNKPKSADEPVAIEIELPEAGRRQGAVG